MIPDGDDPATEVALRGNGVMLVEGTLRRIIRPPGVGGGQGPAVGAGRVPNHADALVGPEGGVKGPA
jgi:hypothetical protein